MDTAELGSTDGKELDISGIQPLDSSVVDGAEDGTEVLTVPLSTMTCDDYVWFQAPVTVKGYREKVPDTVGLW